MTSSKRIPCRNPRLSFLYMKYRKFIPKILRSTLEQKIIFKLCPHAYDLYMSLGENCLPASALNQLKLRKFSGPYDWLAKNGLADRVQQIEDNFENSLNYEDLVFDLEIHDQRAKTCTVKNSRTGFLYLHDFHDDSEDVFLKVQEKYRRRQQRLYTLAKGTNALFVYTDFGSGLHYSDYSSREIKEYFALMERLYRKLELQRLTLILGVRADTESQCDFVDLYEQDHLRIFVQTVPDKYLTKECDLFAWPGIFLKRALQIATDIEWTDKS